MHTTRSMRGVAVILVFLAFLFCVTTNAAAISSTNYEIQEDFLGGSGSRGSSSNSYQTVQDAAAVPGGTGSSSGTAYRLETGPATTDDPTLSFSVNSTSVPLGDMSPAMTKTNTATFSVLNYTSYGYIVKVLGTPPKMGAYTMNGMGSPAASSIGTEQFGINLKANTSPVSFGADPVQTPDNTFSFGDAATGYDTANVFKYVSGDTVASAPKSSGQTDYTVSYIANVSTATPGGSYSTNQTFVCVGTY